MKEKLIQYIWQFQYFNQSALTTSSGEPIEIVYRGEYNHHQGPDFSGATIRIGNTIWAGNIEIHTYSSDWNNHKHSTDELYSNIILHVVWIHDSDIRDINGDLLATLELNSRVSKILLSRYEALMNSSSFIACQSQIHSVNSLVINNWHERLVIERFVRRSSKIFGLLNENNFHWEETFWWLIARNFGMTINADCFESIARSIPLQILAKHKTGILQLEALLFGQASLLDQPFNEAYPRMLQKEYRFYKKKYHLIKVPLKILFLRMRPANFPTLRLAQLAALINTSSHLFSKIKEFESIKKVEDLLDITPNDYWHYHYRFDEYGKFKVKKPGKQMVSNILSNTIIPALFAYGLYHNEERYKEKALDWLAQIAAEHNNITKAFEKFKMPNPNAFASQALIELKKQYCDPKRCLECAIGNAVLKI